MFDVGAGKILDSILDIIVVTDGDLKIIDVNGAVASAGFDKSDLIGYPVTDLVVDNHGLRTAVPELIESARNGLRDLRRFESVRKDGSKFWADISVSEIDDTEELDYLFVFHDVDERAKARKELEEQKARIEAVLGETEELRRQAELSKLELAQANELLAKRQEMTEKALLEEQQFRLSSVKTGFQKTFVTYLAVLIGASLLLPYVGILLGAGDKVTDNTANLSLLLIQAITGVSGFIFGQRSSDKGRDGGED